MDPRIAAILERFVNAAKGAFGDDLRSVVLFGSGAEDALRPTSDVNVIVVTKSFDAARAARLRDEAVLAGAAIRLKAMFLLESEVADAAEAFAVKFEDVRRRHRVLFGDDPFVALEVPRSAAIFRLRQVLLNLALRLRGRLVVGGGDADDLAASAADATGPLRAAASEVLALEGRPAPTPKDALRSFAGLRLDALSTAREAEPLPLSEAVLLVEGVIAVAEDLRHRAAGLT